MTPPTLALIGFGRMLEALAARAIADGWPRARLVAAHRRAERRAEIEARLGLSPLADAAAAAARADLVVLGLPPQRMAEALRGLPLRPGQAVLSLAAALTLPWLAARLPDGVHLLRLTPPPTARLGLGVAFLSAAPGVPQPLRDAAEAFARPGAAVVEWVEDAEMEPLTAILSGLTPFLAALLAALLADGAARGLGAERLRRLAAPALAAAARLLAEDGTPPADALAEAATKGGLTERALRVMEEAGFRRAVSAAVEAMLVRAAELRDAPG
jgi:pyrroline-5-carboxylate reductase